MDDNVLMLVSTCSNLYGYIMGGLEHREDLTPYEKQLLEKAETLKHDYDKVIDDG